MTESYKRKISRQASLPSRDECILEALRRREESALEEVTRRYGTLLHGIARRITGNPSDAEECVNDALLDLWNQVPPDSPTHMGAYICTLVRRRAIDRVRYNAAKQRAGDVFLASAEELAECLPDPTGDDPCETLAIRDCLQAFMDRLEEEDRRIFLLRYYRFETHETIAAQCGISKSAVAMRLMRLRKKLRRALAENGISI